MTTHGQQKSLEVVEAFWVQWQGLKALLCALCLN